VTPATAMLALMSSNLHQYLGEREAGMALFARLLRRLPCYRMHLSDDAMRNGKLLRRLLQRLPMLAQPAQATGNREH
jgi:exopolyphosphatase/pppGpp-phosphohydrolase